MTNETMTVHEALCELKTIGKRIDKAISQGVFVRTKRHSDAMIDGKSVDDFKNQIKASYQKVTDLIRRREAIKKAVTQSNATTIVTIGNLEMSVAEAIEYKNSGVDYKTKLLENMSRSYEVARRAINQNNGDALQSAADSYIAALFGSKESIADVSIIENAKNAYIENNSLDLVDPISIVREIERISEEIDNFTTKVDSALSISNAITTITFSY